MNTEFYSFVDFYHNDVEITFKKNPYSDNPRHVWVICKYNNMWLMTRHKERGIEFPGGKVEVEETPEEAVLREVFEETGGHVNNLLYIGQYKVIGKQDIVVKNVYYAEVDQLTVKDDYYETSGPVLFKKIPANIITDKNFSFIMKDEVLTYCLKWLKKYFNELS